MPNQQTGKKRRQQQGLQARCGYPFSASILAMVSCLGPVSSGHVSIARSFLSMLK
jgi:hypothetical protein